MTARWADADKPVRAEDVLDLLTRLRDEAAKEDALHDGEYDPDRRRYADSTPARVQGFILDLIDGTISGFEATL